ncbi:hypothetical protein TrCOL_g11652 [Triparma columacea]|uniref:Centriolar satellite-associated tubulin polyglutamylase complex regulator 1 n=1 Tax=Triparma columacea TaxID=722753 RepID=A0A9W7LAA8_9STRA|nr:hypothetical protein TrCOL_g11652 [Triparma columacea]
MPRVTDGERRAAFLHTLSSGTFLSQSKVQVYLNDALNILLKVSSHQATSPQTPSAFSASQRPLRFLSNYFEGVLDETVNHTVGKNFAYICCTRYNRGTFLKGFVSCTSGISEKQSVLPDDFYQLALSLCPDFLRAIVHTVAWFQNGGRATASTSLVKFQALRYGFAIYFYYLEFWLLAQVFFQAAYDGASGGVEGRKAIVMPALVCSVDTSPIRELTSIYASNADRAGSTPNPTWRRAFGCSVDCAHVVTALGRIERGCRGAGVPYIPREVWEPAISSQGGKLTLEKSWAVITRDPWLRESLACILEGE